MYTDNGPPMSETQSTGSGRSEAEASSPPQQEQLLDTSSRVSCENCTVSPDNARLKGNSWPRYNQESQRETSGCNPTASQSYAWPVNGTLPYQNPNVFQPNQPRTYGSPILEQQQRPTILVIVVNKPNNGNAPGNYPATFGGGYPVRGYHNGVYSPTVNPYPIRDYQQGGYTSFSDTTAGSPSNDVINSENNQALNNDYDNGQNQIPSSGATIEPENQVGSDSGQDRKQRCACCSCCTPENQHNNNETGPFTTLNGTDTADCTCEMGELEKLLASLIPNENCYCYLANMVNKKKKKKRKPRSVFDRFASPPFVIEPKPNICMHCCCQRSCPSPCSCSCCASCNKSCCNSCCPWY